MDTKSNKIRLPVIKEVKFHDFDLYTNNPNVVTSIEKNVYCLIGANGLGKSTFLNSITYCVTGAIPLPSNEKVFTSTQEYSRDATKETRTADYFNGRISEKLRDTSKITVLLECANYRIEVSRHFFSDGKPSFLSFEDLENNSTTTYDLKKYTPSSLDEIYQKKITEITGLKDFNQYLFLFHFVSVFDESRSLLLWDNDILTNALYIAFGTDPSVAVEADKLQHEMDKEDSRGRNAKFAARQIKRQIDDLEKILKGNHTDDELTRSEVKLKHNKLIENLKYAQQRVENKLIEKKDFEVKCSELNAKFSSLEIEYRKAFSSRLSGMSHLQHHPIIKLSISDNKCALCNTHDDEIASRLEALISKNQCPLCLNSIDSHNIEDRQALEEIKNIDIERIKIKESLEVAYQQVDRSQSELGIAENNQIAARNELESFENDNRSTILLSNSPNGDFISEQLQSLLIQIDKFNSISSLHYKKRDVIREQLRKFEKELKINYASYAESFVLRFRELAKEFIGMPVDVELIHHKSKKSGFGLVLHLNNKLRTKADKLSESQRFFIDIALRMAITEFMCNGPATLLIDTPEGSLDIAYEARAGSMFSKYAQQNNYIVMTANLRSSYLVLRLAKLQKESGMQIIKMTEWTNLTEVQKSEEELFIRAYKDINEEMKIAN